MTIKITLKNNLYCPGIICDHCGEIIATVKEGNYEWQVDENGQPLTGELVFLHKQCSREYDDTHGGRIQWYWGELRMLIFYLAHNLKYDPEEARKLADTLP